MLILSHSGGTFASLACANLLAAFTTDIFAITSEWDTQVAAAVRGHHNQRGSWNFSSFVFTTFAGCRPAEPCSISVAATHQLLTQLLLYVMYYYRYFLPGEANLGGSSYTREEVQELAELNRSNLATVREIVGRPNDRYGRPDSDIGKSLRAHGRRWAWHVLEAPLSWIVSFVYIAVTVTVGVTPLSAAVAAVYDATSDDSSIGPGGNSTDGCSASDEMPQWLNHVRGFVDAIIYAFLPWWTTVLIRLVQRRPWLHRVAGRSILIGDIPWVAQAVEAYASKLFALSYSISSVSVASGNPADHLVHRHTHRVVRGSLLVVGRPDGRLNALTSAESTTCLSVNQASSIQNLGITCESITIGHNPFQLPLSHANIVIPTLRSKFLCEAELEAMAAKQSGAAVRAEEKPGLKPGLTLKDAIEVTIAGGAGTDAGAQDGKGASGRSQSVRSSGSSGSKPALKRELSIKGVARLAKSRSKSKAPKEPRDDGKSAGAMMGMMADILGESSLVVVADESAAEERPPMFDKIPALEQPFFGAWMARHPRFRGKNTGQLMHAQLDVQALYETRFASLQRFVSHTVLFHAMAQSVQDFWTNWSLGLLGYDMSRTQSIMRIATTASPVSGSDVRERMAALELASNRLWAVNLLQRHCKWWLQVTHIRRMGGPRAIPRAPPRLAPTPDDDEGAGDPGPAEGAEPPLSPSMQTHRC